MKVNPLLIFVLAAGQYDWLATAVRSTMRVKHMQKLGKLGMTFEHMAHKNKSTSFLASSKPTLPPNVVLDDQRSCTGFWLVGCMAIEKKTSHAIFYKDHTVEEDRAKMTPEVCYEFCKSIDGATFFGIEMGRDCYCMPYYAKTASGVGAVTQGVKGPLRRCVVLKAKLQCGRCTIAITFLRFHATSHHQLFRTLKKPVPHCMRTGGQVQHRSTQSILHAR
jgi:hypothetical protein